MRFTEESCAKIQAFGIENELLDLPYHISYGIFDKETGTETSTNDPFIPLLPLTEKKSRHYFEKDFYIDQNLNIFYFSKEIEYSGKPYIIQLSMDLERDPNLQFFFASSKNHHFYSDSASFNFVFSVLFNYKADNKTG